MNTIVSLRNFIIFNILILLFSLSCINKNHDNIFRYNYNYCDNYGNYGEIYFFEDSLMIVYPNYYCDTSNSPGQVFYIYKQMSDDSIYIQSFEDRILETYTGKIIHEKNKKLFLEINTNGEYIILDLERIDNNEFMPPFNVTIDSIEKWHYYTFYPNYLKRLKERNCQCKDEYDNSWKQEFDTLFNQIISLPDSI